MTLIIGVPNRRLLDLSFADIEKEINKSDSAEKRLYDWKNVAVGLGEINRNYSKYLSEKEFFELQQKMTRVRRIFQRKNAKYKLAGRKQPFPTPVIEKWFSGENPR